jgi:hypothetical protein
VDNIDAKDALTFLKAVYQHPKVPLSVRMRAASIAIPFELPKLAVTAVLSNQDDFATRLDRALDRSAKEMRMLPGPIIEHHHSSEHPASELRPTNGQLKRRF